MLFQKKLWLIEPLINKGLALRNITDNNPLCNNDAKCRHQIVILLKVVNDATPC